MRSFSSLLSDTYECMVSYRESMRNGDIQRINHESACLQSCIQKMHLYYEGSQFSEKENSAKAKQIVEQFNLYVHYYSQFIAYPPEKSRMSAPAQQCAKTAEELFNSLIIMILKYIREDPEE